MTLVGIRRTSKYTKRAATHFQCDHWQGVRGERMSTRYVGAAIKGLPHLPDIRAIHCTANAAVQYTVKGGTAEKGS